MSKKTKNQIDFLCFIRKLNMKYEEILVFFKRIVPNLKEFDENSKNGIEKLKIQKKTHENDGFSKKNVMFIPKKEIYKENIEEMQPFSARNGENSKENQMNLNKRRRSLSFAGKIEEIPKNYPFSAQNFNENRINSEKKSINLSEINESEERIFEENSHKTDKTFDNEIIYIQNKLLKEKNEEISFLKNKLKNFKDLCKFFS